MNGHLYPRLPFSADETPVSFASRLAAFHTEGTLPAFLATMDIKLMELAGGSEGAIARLADISGEDPEILAENAVRMVGRRRYRLRGQEISAEFLRGKHAAFCPACLLADDAEGGEPAVQRRGRLIWSLRAVRTCPVHHLALIERPSTSWGDFALNLEERVPERGSGLEALIARTSERACSPLQDYVVDRLDRRPGPAWLDGQTLEQAVRAAEMLGVLLEFGPTPDLNAFMPDDWDRAGRAGFAVASGGEGAIREMLSAVQGAFRYGGSKPGPQKVFGRLYQWLASSKARKDPGDLKRILRDHVFDSFELPDGAQVLGGTLECRRFHSVASLARECGQDTRTLRHVLIAHGLVPDDPEAGPHQIFDAEMGRTVAASITRIVHVISLPKALNCTRPQAAQLLDERVLAPLLDGAAPGPGRLGKAIDARDVSAFLEKLRSAARPVDQVPEGLVPIAKAAEKVSAPSVEILHLVLGGFLENVVRLNGVEGYAAIHVDPVEVRWRVGEIMFGLSPAEAFGRLKIPNATGWALAASGPEGAILPSIPVRGPNGRHEFRRFREEEVADCAAAYTTRPRIANALGIEIAELRNRLRAVSVRPFFPKRHIGVDLYRVADLPSPFRP
ncbi:TniQ protein [Rhodovulum sp. ES.010]|uniref:TniQ family protein n=1 Tax=Rhodovulum sp. ES.010 TaxID=1882821 RepID=UPI00092BA4A6|nr:TniQ family protein [Rhodovulum sp. ES.010]SIO39403.1 TniQ protein [Rhodovulum sp. ES.010]